MWANISPPRCAQGLTLDEGHGATATIAPPAGRKRLGKSLEQIRKESA